MDMGRNRACRGGADFILTTVVFLEKGPMTAGRGSFGSWELMHPHLEVIRELCAPSISRVHGDEDPTRLDQADLAALKEEALEAGLEGVLDGEELPGWKMLGIWGGG